MGCAPSKGNHFGAFGPLRKSRMLPPPPVQSPRERLTEDGASCSFPGPSDPASKERITTGQNQDSLNNVHVSSQKKCVPDLTHETTNMHIVKIQGQGNDRLSQRNERTTEKTTDKKLSKKAKKNSRSAKISKKKEKETDTFCSDQKVDFPEPLVRAHQGAYAFLNPSIVKYDSLIELLEQATQTHVLLQPMVAFMALRYDEIIQELDGIAEEGEKVFKEYGEHLAWPSQMKNLSSSAAKCGPADGEPPPDLLQQLLQYTTQRMRNVSHSVSQLGDSALEEAVVYFTSVSELLEEKLKTKQAVERRLMHLLCRIEMASLRKPGPEDSALFSEDSGIGGESESLAGSDKQHRPGSCGSTGTNRTMSASPMRRNSFPRGQRYSRQMFMNQISPSISMTSLNSLGSACTILANEQDSLLGSFSGEDDEADEGIRGKCKYRPRSTSVDRNHPRRLPPRRIENPQNMEMTLKMKNAISGRIQFEKSKPVDSPKRTRQQWTEDKEQTPKRPQTAKSVGKKAAVTKARRSQSAESLKSRGEDPTLLELERTQKDLNQKLQKMSKNKNASNIKTSTAKLTQRTPIIQSPKRTRKSQSLEKNIEGNKVAPAENTQKKQEENSEKDGETSIIEALDITNGFIKNSAHPTPPSSPRPSSRLCRGRNSVKKLIDTFSQSAEEREGPIVLGPLRGVKKCGVPVMPGLGNVEAVLSSGITSCRTEPELEKTDFLDLDNLPPPPIEVLMDKSFECAKSMSAGLPEDSVNKVNVSPMPKRAMLSQRLKASVQPATVLPSKGSVLPASKNKSIKVSREETHSQPQPPEKEHNPLYQQARRIINLRSSHAEKTAGCVLPESSSNREKSTEMKDITVVSGPHSAGFAVNTSASTRSQPPSSPSAAKSRMLPSTPSTPSLLHRRLPSPGNLRRQPSPTSSSSSSSTASTSSNSTFQRRLPSTPKPNTSTNPTLQSYPFKAPSPPASPKLHRWSRQNSREDVSRQMPNNARSVFCPASPKLFEASPCSVPGPPEAWTSSKVSFLSRMWGGPGRLSTKDHRARALIRRTQSDRRSSLHLPPQSPSVSYAETCGSEPMIYSPGLEDDPVGEDGSWGSQSELRATLRSASHPDLCVVGQSLHME